MTTTTRLTPAEVFAKRDRHDFREALKWTPEEIEARMLRLPVRPPYWDRLRRSQQICVVIGAHLKRFAFFNDMGTGKTFITLSLAAYWQTQGAKRFLVLVPNRININGWMAQIRKHTPDLKAVALPSKMADKMNLLMYGDALLFVETYAGFARLCSKANGSKLHPDPAMLDRMAELLDGIIVDESSMIGNHGSLQRRVVQGIADRDKDLCTYLLSGTPFGRDPHLLWPQMFLVDGGWSLGQTLGLFRSVFFTVQSNYWTNYDYVFKPKATALLNRCIAHRSIRVALDEADLPSVTPIVVELDLAKDADQYYAAAIKKMRAAKGNYELMQNTFMRMRQISSGFINMTDPDTQQKERLTLKENPKLEWIKVHVPNITGQVIIFHEFNYSGEVLKRELDALKVSNVTIRGGLTDAARTAAFDAFTSGKAQVLLLNSKAGAFGVNLQMAKYGIFYESPVAVIERQQTQLRFIRPESEHQHVVMYDLVMKGTVDRDILDFHVEGRDLFAAILDGSLKL